VQGLFASALLFRGHSFLKKRRFAVEKWSRGCYLVQGFVPAHIIESCFQGGKIMFCKKLYLPVFIGILLLAVFGVTFSTAKGQPKLENADCQKCHVRESQSIAVLGMAHLTAITCQSCHEGHRPQQEQNIPSCALCHAGSAHYELASCSGCHDPHAPLEIQLQGDVQHVCLSCHSGQGKELQGLPSKHTELSCNTCHEGKHRAETLCASCHAPHAPAQTQADCRLCHQPHMPTALNYGSSIPSQHCVACHDQAGDKLAATPTRHRSVACATCHPQKHGTIAACSDCHGTPHAKGMHERFPRCGDCHGPAHDMISGSTSAAKR
jgi:predicted CXXCH cytochrome family protein